MALHWVSVMCMLGGVVKACKCLEEYFGESFLYVHGYWAWECVLALGLCVCVGVGGMLDVGVCAGCRGVRAELTLARGDESLGQPML